MSRTKAAPKLAAAPAIEDTPEDVPSPATGATGTAESEAPPRPKAKRLTPLQIEQLRRARAELALAAAVVTAAEAEWKLTVMEQRGIMETLRQQHARMMNAKQKVVQAIEHELDVDMSKLNHDPETGMLIPAMPK